MNSTPRDSVIHDFIYCHIRNKCKEGYINHSDLLYLIKNVLRVPKSMDYLILKELESRGFIKKRNHQSYYICKGNKTCDISIKKIKKYKDFAFW